MFFYCRYRHLPSEHNEIPIPVAAQKTLNNKLKIFCPNMGTVSDIENNEKNKFRKEGEKKMSVVVPAELFI